MNHSPVFFIISLFFNNFYISISCFSKHLTREKKKFSDMKKDIEVSLLYVVFQKVACLKNYEGKQFSFHMIFLCFIILPFSFSLMFFIKISFKIIFSIYVDSTYLILLVIISIVNPHFNINNANYEWKLKK